MSIAGAGSGRKCAAPGGDSKSSGTDKEAKQNADKLDACALTHRRSPADLRPGVTPVASSRASIYVHCAALSIPQSNWSGCLGQASKEEDSYVTGSGAGAVLGWIPRLARDHTRLPQPLIDQSTLPPYDRGQMSEHTERLIDLARSRSSKMIHTRCAVVLAAIALVALIASPVSAVGRAIGLLFGLLQGKERCHGHARKWGLHQRRRSRPDHPHCPSDLVALARRPRWRLAPPWKGCLALAAS